MMTKLLLALITLAASASVADAATRCAQVRDGAVVAYKDIPDSDLVNKETGCWPDAPHKGIKWLPAPKADEPSFDPATQVRTGPWPTVVVGDDQVTTEYPVRGKTEQELADEAATKAAEEAAALEADKESSLTSLFGKVLVGRLCDQENRIRVLEGKATVTLAQCRAAIKGDMK